MRRWMGAAVLTLVVGGCAAGLPDPGEVRLSAAMALPVRARVLVDVAQSDLDRKFTYDINAISPQDTGLKDGVAMQQAAVGLLGHAFAAVTANQPSPRPDVVARVTGTAVFNQVAGTFHVVCGIDAVRADGIPLGHFYATYKSQPVMSLEASLPRVYAQCLKGPVEDLLRSPEFTRLAAAGFPAPDPAVVDGYLRSQGYMVR